MKFNITHGQVTRWVLGVVFALVFAGVLCRPLLNSHPRSTSPTPGQPLRRSTVSLVLGPNLRGVAFLPSGPVSGAADATARAVTAANSVARRDYDMEPFRELKGTASFDGRVWTWRKRVGSGLGDFEAEVKIAPDGTIQTIRVEYLTQQLARK